MTDLEIESALARDQLRDRVQLEMSNTVLALAEQTRRDREDIATAVADLHERIERAVTISKLAAGLSIIAAVLAFFS